MWTLQHAPTNGYFSLSSKASFLAIDCNKSLTLTQHQPLHSLPSHKCLPAPSSFLFYLLQPLSSPKLSLQHKVSNYQSSNTLIHCQQNYLYVSKSLLGNRTPYAHAQSQYIQQLQQIPANLLLCVRRAIKPSSSSSELL